MALTRRFAVGALAALTMITTAAVPAVASPAATPKKLVVSGQVTLKLTATTSDSDSCTGTCGEEDIGSADYSSYSRTASGSISASAKFTVNDGGTITPGSGPATVKPGSYSTSATFTQLISQCGPLKGTGTVTRSSGGDSGSLNVTAFTVVNSQSGNPDLQVGWDLNPPPTGNTLITLTTTPCPVAPFEFPDVTEERAVSAVAGQVLTGWTINPNWTASKGGTLATKAVDASVPEPPSEPGAAESGTETAHESWELITKPVPLEITSPPDNATIAVTDPKYVMPQAAADGRAPKNRTLKVEGTAQCAGPVDINGVSVPVNGGTWSADLPVGKLGLGPVALTAKAKNCGQVSNSLTLIDLVITTPAENASLPITASPAMPPLNATIDVRGYSGDASHVPFDWTLKVKGETVRRPGTWTDYAKNVATGTTTGASEAWKPSYPAIVGGIGRLVVSASLPGVTDKVTSDPRWINIPGTNPPAKVAKKFVDANESKFADTLRHIVCIESGWRQFNRRVDSREPAVGGVPADWKPNPGASQPLYGPPAGIGIAQLDPAALTGPDQYWDWKQNLRGGIDIFHMKLAQAKAHALSEQHRLATRLARALRRANANRKVQGLPPLNISVIKVPALNDNQIKRQTIRLYNGGNEYRFDADYVLAADNIHVTRTGSEHWVGKPAGNWGRTSRDLHVPMRWVPLKARFQGYVNSVLGCKNS